MSPVRLPLRPGLVSRDDAAPSEFLPGLFEDSVPDRWGLRLLYDWFRKKGVPEHEVTPLMMLSYVGERSMGALVYEPEDGPPESARIDLGNVYREATSHDADGPQVLSQILADIGSPPGGAQPKALIALPADGRLEECYGGSRKVPSGYDAWLVKFSPTRILNENFGSDGRMEEAYALMARAAGIELPSTRLLSTGQGKSKHLHFAAKRFDREGNERIHHHTLAGMTHMRGGDLDYETLLTVTRAVTRDEREVLKAFRRAVFNVLACNDDDHGRNHGFLYRAGEWKLGPAYDVTFRRLRERGLAVCGMRSGVSLLQLVCFPPDSSISSRRSRPTSELGCCSLATRSSIIRETPLLSGHWVSLISVTISSVGLMFVVMQLRHSTSSENRDRWPNSIVSTKNCWPCGRARS